MSKEFKVHCSIIDYLRRSKDHEGLVDLIDGLCLSGFLNPSGKNRLGVTFLIPDNATIKAIEKLAYSDSIKDVEAASDMLRACIINDVLPDAKAWDLAKENIPNALRKKVKVKEVKGKTVTFKNGSVATLDENFKAQGKGPEKEQRFAVWTLKGEMEKGDEDAMLINKDAARKNKKKGSAEKNEEIEKFITEHFRAQVEYHYMDKKDKYENALLKVITALNYYLRVNLNEGKLLAEIHPLKTGLPEIDILVLFYGNLIDNQYLVEFIRWFKDIKYLNVRSMKSENKVAEEVDRKLVRCKACDDLPNLLKFVSDKRIAIQDENPKQRVTAIKNAYKELLAMNIFPERVQSFIKSSESKKLLLDYFTYALCGCIIKLRKDPVYHINRYKDLCQSVLRVLDGSESDHNSIMKETLLNDTKLGFRISPIEIVDELDSFVCSLPFLHIKRLSADELKANNVKIIISLKNNEGSGILHIMKWVGDCYDSNADESSGSNNDSKILYIDKSGVHNVKK